MPLCVAAKFGSARSALHCWAALLTTWPADFPCLRWQLRIACRYFGALSP